MVRPALWVGREEHAPGARNEGIGAKMAPGSTVLRKTSQAGRGGGGAPAPQMAPSSLWAPSEQSIGLVDPDQSSRIQAERRPGVATCCPLLPLACSQEPPHHHLPQIQPCGVGRGAPRPCLPCPPPLPTPLSTFFTPRVSPAEGPQLGQLLPPLLITCSQSQVLHTPPPTTGCTSPPRPGP